MQNLSENDALCLVLDHFKSQLYFGFSALVRSITDKVGLNTYPLKINQNWENYLGMLNLRSTNASIHCNELN